VLTGVYLYFLRNTLAFNGAFRLSLLAILWHSTCNSEVIFDAGTALVSHHRQLAVTALGIYSSSSMFLW
jgi:hypothetical protein